MRRLDLPFGRIFDNVLFAGLAFAVLLIAMWGKAIAELLFNHKHIEFQIWGYGFTAYIAVAGGAAILQLLRMEIWRTRPTALILATVGMIVPVVVQLYARRGSTLVFMLQVYIFVAFGVVAIVERLFSRHLVPEFWTKFLSVYSSAVKLILALYTAGSALLQFVALKNGEDWLNVVATLAFPSLILIFTLFVWTYWLFLPATEIVIPSYSSVRTDSVQVHQPSKLVLPPQANS